MQQSQGSGHGNTEKESHHRWLVRGVLGGIGAVLILFLASRLEEWWQRKPPVVPKNDWYGWIEISSTQCRAWVVPPPPQARSLGEPVTFNPELVAVTFPNKPGAVPSLELNLKVIPQMQQSVKKWFQELTSSEQVPPENIFIVANGFLSKTAAGEANHSRQLLDEAVAAATGHKQLHFHYVRAQAEVEVKTKALIPEAKRYDAFLLDVGSDMVRIGWMEQEPTRAGGKATWMPKIRCLSYPLQESPAWNDLEDDVEQRHPQLNWLMAKSVYRLHSFPPRLKKYEDKLLERITEVQECADESVWIRAYIDGRLKDGTHPPKAGQ